MKTSFLDDIPVAAIATALVASLWVEGRFIASVAASLGGRRDDWISGLPVALLSEPSHASLFSTHTSLVYVAIAVVQVALLFALRERLERSAGAVALGICAAAFVAMIAVDLHASAAISSDAYAYIGYAKLPSVHAAYAIANPPLGQSFAAINRLWGSPLPPCVYGPLWILTVHVLLAPIASIGSSFEMLRILGAVGTAVLVLLVYAISRSTVLAAVTALTPPLHVQFVMDAHNDVLAIVPILLALVAARRSWWGAAFALIVVGATMKLNMAIVGLLVTLTLPLRLRIAFVAGLAGTIALVYAALSGTAFVAAIRYVKIGSALHAMHRIPHAQTFSLIEIIALAGALAVCTIGFFSRRLWLGASGIFVALGSTLIFPWYLVWGLPYALLASPRGTVTVMCIAPLLAVLLEPETHYAGHGTVALGIIALCAVTLGSAWTAYGRGSISLRAKYT